MSKINELIYDVREAVKEFTDDTEFDDRYILYLYNIKRAKYLRQDLNNYQKTTDNSIQQKFCIGLEEVSSNECGVNLTCDTLLRTIKPIPTPLELSSKVAITQVRPTDRLKVNFDFIPLEKAPYIGYGTIGNTIHSFLGLDGYIYVYSKSDDYKNLECLTVSGIFEDPLELSNYEDCCNCTTPTTCFDEDESEYPLQPHYISLIREEIIRDLLRTKQIREDKENDATDSQA